MLRPRLQEFADGTVSDVLLRSDVPSPALGKAARPLLVVDGLTVAYGQSDLTAAAVKDVSFTIDEGERVALVGETGSGKSTLALAVSGFLAADTARITARSLSFGGTALGSGGSRRLPRRIPGVTMVFQDAMTSLDPLWSIGSQLGIVVRLNERLNRNQSASRVRYWLKRVGLKDLDRVMKARPYELSGGMRQRVMLAIAIASRPRLLIADEPTSALDASVAREVMDLLMELTEEASTSLLIVSHDLHLCQGYADKILVMLNGRLVEQLAGAELGSGARHAYTRGLLRCVPTLGSFDLDLLPTLGTAGPDGGH